MTFFSILSSDVKALILANSSPAQLPNLAFVCRDFKSLVQNANVWKMINEREFPPYILDQAEALVETVFNIAEELDLIDEKKAERADISFQICIYKTAKRIIKDEIVGSMRTDFDEIFEEIIRQLPVRELSSELIGKNYSGRCGRAEANELAGIKYFLPPDHYYNDDLDEDNFLAIATPNVEAIAIPIAREEDHSQHGDDNSVEEEEDVSLDSYNSDNSAPPPRECLASSLEDPNQHITHLDFSEIHINNVLALKLIAVLSHPNCQTVFLKGFRVSNTDDTALKALATALIHPRCKLSYLQLICKKATRTGIVYFAKALRDSRCRLTHLLLPRNNIDEKTARIISNTLKQGASSIIHLDLQDNQVRDLGAIDLAIALINQNCRLNFLNLHKNEITDIGVAAFAIAFVHKNCHLTHFNIGWNHVGDSGALVLVGAIKSPHCQLTALDCSVSDLGPEGIKAFAFVLMHRNNHLVYLNLSEHALGDEEAIAFAPALKHPNCKLTLFNFAGGSCSFNAYQPIKTYDPQLMTGVYWPSEIGLKALAEAVVRSGRDIEIVLGSNEEKFFNEYKQSLFNRSSLFAVSSSSFTTTTTTTTTTLEIAPSCAISKKAT